MALADIGKNVLDSFGVTIKAAGEMVEATTSAGAGVLKNAIVEAKEIGVAVEDSAGELAGHTIQNAASVGGSLANAMTQAIEAAGNVGESTTGAASRTASGVVKAAGQVSAEAGSAVRNAVTGTIRGVNTVIKGDVQT